LMTTTAITINWVSRSNHLDLLWGYIKESITARSTSWTERTRRQSHSNNEYGFAM
jgi:hypothetical protein